MSDPATGWRDWLRATADLVWPRVCLVCDAAVPPDTPPGCVCPACRSAVLTDPHLTCPRCTSTVGPHADLTGGCPRCRTRSFRFAGAVRLGPYAGKLRDAVLRMKSAAGEPLAETLGRLWADARRDQLRAGDPQAIVPVPLHWRRRWGRGYNQAEALAVGLAAGLGLPVRAGWLARLRPTPMQTARSATERWENVRGAFGCRAAGVRGLRVLLVDDVMTTGGTADAASGALLAAGAAQVRVAVVAHR